MRSLRRRLLSQLVLALILFPAPALTAAPDSATTAEVDSYIKSQMDRLHIPGLSLAVVKDGQVIYQNAYGLADLELKVPVTTDTVFQIQSITKTFTATAIMMLAEEGKVGLDDPVSKYLDGTPESWRPITIRHLLTHTSGIKDFINEPTASLRLDVSEQQVLEATAPRPLNFTPGERYAYSNTGYHLLAMIIRKVTGQSYGDFLGQRIFKPLDMTHTRVQQLSEVIPGRARGYLWRNGKLVNGGFVAQPILSYGGGGILSTAGDLAKWDAALRNDTLLKQSTLEQMWTPATFNDGEKSNYGLGWGVNSYSGHRFVQHSGSHVTGFQSFIRRYLDDGLTVIVLINQNGRADPGKIVTRIAGIFDPALAPPIYKPIDDKEPQIAARVKELCERASRGELKEDEFDPELWTQLSPNLTTLRVFTLAAGPIDSPALVERKDESGQRLYRYRIGLKDGAWLVLVGFGGDGKICKLAMEMAEE
jgi:D-alanyl-D-alanine carboxypeptidase